MRKAYTPLILALTVALLGGCTDSPTDTGSARFAVSASQNLSSNISRVSVTSSGADIPSVTVDLAATNGVWGGIIGNIPAGSNRSFRAQAFDSSGTLLFEGSASDVTISANQSTLVAITLQQLNPPPPFDNEAPIIDSLVASSTSVAAGGSISLTATAHDPNPGDTLSYAWTATAGSFSSTSESSTSWTAPASTGIQTLTLTVTDSRGLASSVQLAVNVTQAGGEGEAQLSISFNSFPVVASLGASPTYLAVGQSTSISASASDPDGDSLSYSWSASCAGSWANASSSSAQFTPSELPAGTCNNCRLTVTVSDGRGGHTTGTVALCVSNTPPVNHLNPVIIRSYRSSDTASPSQELTYEVVASDPEGSALTFSWEATTGSLGTATSDASHSRITWTAPSCVSSSAAPTITATVTNAFNLTATRTFTVTGLPACSGNWALTGSMLGGPRWGHVAALLPNGKVLVAGGSAQKRSFFLSSAELYDPATDTWSATGSMVEARNAATATVLPNGKVLVAGGEGFSLVSATAELYDPATGTWSPTGSMTQPRENHTATLLPNGKVLVVGGINLSGSLATAELYDPATGTWSATGSMDAPLDSHTATLLPNGKVLVVRGTTAQVYDPASGTWCRTDSPLEPINGPATLLPNGQVLVVGGAAAELYNPASRTWSRTTSPPVPIDGPATLLLDGKVLALGGTTAELYDPASSTWSLTNSLHVLRAGYTATRLMDGRVLVAGTPPNTEEETESAEVYTPQPASTSGWSETGSMAYPRLEHTAVLLPNGKVLVAGGLYNLDYLPFAELYDPATGTWSSTGSMTAARGRFTATLLPNGKVLVCGGLNYTLEGDTRIVGTADLYDPATGTWSPTGAMASPRHSHTATLLPNGKVLVVGGYTDIHGSTAPAELYDPATGTWSATGPMLQTRAEHTATLLPNGKVLIAGGNNTNFSTGALASAEVYDPATGTWSPTGSMTEARYLHTATLLPNGKVLVAGGSNPTDVLATAELYDPATGTWSPTGSMSEARYVHTATLLPNGKVLVAGGGTSEVYEPATGTWSTTTPMLQPRSFHTATLLPNGKVLAVGGVFDFTMAELYTP